MRDLKNKVSVIVLLLFAIFASSCQREWVLFDDAFVAFVPDKSSATLVDYRAQTTSSYIVHLTSPKPSQAIIVKYKVIPGDGLKEGVDYELVGTSNEIKFLPGIYETAIKVKWLSHELDKSKDNRLTIRLDSSNVPITLGVIGPDEKNREIIITKY